ncbi:uncharacterized protein ATC70_008974 [Mucor velutinosus]|uniref:Reverse transcriptase domain-containing protein n=1 Tax=Mucor velutinosus TaxID=708070 RepID=A0AAN7I2Z5_9FUNG|nr:hypothetical protein ATC70_008974 [Mucor velutinosus]
MFPRCSFVISKHCAIVCLRKDLELTDTAISLDERCVTASVTDAHHTICKVANVYIPVQKADRHAFLPVLMSMPCWSDILDSQWILLGDFNIHLHNPVEARSPRIKPFVEWLNTHFLNCFPKGTMTLPRTGTTIDYVFCPPHMATRMVNAQTHHIPQPWTDHSLLTADLITSGVKLGPGSWRFNPYLLENIEFQALLDKTIELFLASDYCDGVAADASVSGDGPEGMGLRPVQEKWESLKAVIKYCAQQFTKGQKARYKARVSHFQREREQLLGDEEESARIKTLEQLIEQKIQEDTRQAMLRSATRWLEMGEQNNKYFFRVIKDREAQQTIQSLKKAGTGEKLTDMSEILQEARSFYQVLYTPDDIDLAAVNSLFANIPDDAKLQEAEAERLMEPPSTDSVLLLLDHAPKNKSPGLDGLPFEVYSYLAAKFPPILLLLQQVLTDALNGVFPESWKQTRMVLLFKKGDPELLKNWRPLSLINSDAKIFTKLLANRFKRVLSKLVTPYQTGFMPHRLISDNAWLNQTLMTNLRAAAPDDPNVSVLLDQEKAYDRVNPTYLRMVLHQFGFPASLVESVSSLFFGTHISLSINGWLGAPIQQQRGLRQGDPLSPLLFNLAFEPFLRTILACSELRGVAMSTNTRSPLAGRTSNASSQIPPHGNHDLLRAPESPPRIKLLSYADDLEVFLTSTAEWPVLLSLLSLYGKASNAKVNLNKTILVSLSGKRHESWTHLAETSNIEWYDESSIGSVRYLGYPLYHTKEQLAHFLDSVTVNLQRQCNLLKKRQLSIRGKGLVANSLLLSRMWHLLRVVVVPAEWLQEVKRIVRTYIVSFWPVVSWDSLCLPRKHGGLGLVDIENQHLALHLIYVKRLLLPRAQTDFLSPWLLYTFHVYSGHATALPLLMYPRTYMPRLRKCPHLAHLARLISRLPTLTPYTQWPSWWFLDLPWSSVCSLSPTETLSRASDKLPPHALIANLLSVLPDTNILACVRPLDAISLQHLFNALCPFVGPSVWIIPAPLRSVMAFTDQERTAMLESQPTPSPPTASFSHWYITTGPRSKATMAQIKLGALRRYWHPSFDLLRGPAHPPRYRPTHLLIPPRLWRDFWSLCLPAKAFTPWWRLLHGHLSVQARLHIINRARHPSPLCKLCTEAPEDEYHLVVGCDMKSLFWFEVISHLGLSDLFPTDNAIWIGLSTLHDQEKNPLDISILELLGAAFSSLWQHHWSCSLDGKSWRTQIVFSSFLADHSKLISSFLDDM